MMKTDNSEKTSRSAKISFEDAQNLAKKGALQTKEDIKRTGRKKKEVDERKTEMVKTYLTIDEKRALETHANGIPISNLIYSTLQNLGLLK
jgi:hypothetical protein